MNTEQLDQSTSELGIIQIAPEVLETIAGLAAIQVEGVAEMSGGIVGGISDLLRMKSLTKGVKVQIGTNETLIDISIVIEYGCCIPDVARQIQQIVHRAIYDMTGIRVTAVHIHIESVHYNEDQKRLDNEPNHTTLI